MPHLKAQATIHFPNIAKYFDTLIHSFSAHNMELQADGDGHAITSSFGAARMRARPAALDLFVEASDADRLQPPEA
ncbi:MAG: DUF2218 domain-containing protein [Azospirillaceae bacterium]|nr:DUF2218 domain-containing protein [Azospirillaceae bacterium]